MPTCSGCKRNLPNGAFYARRDRPRGLSSRCRECISASGALDRRNQNQRVDAGDRFLSKLHRNSDGCLVWLGHVERGGYGVFWDGVRLVKAHRMALRLAGIAVPAGYEVDHLCRNRACCNVEHLDVVTTQKNVHRSFSPAGINSRKRFCDLGHELSGANLYVRPCGRRACRACMRIADAKRSPRGRSVRAQA